MQNIVLICFDQELKNHLSFSEFSDNLLQNANIIIQNSFDNFDIVHKTCSILV